MDSASRGDGQSRPDAEDSAGGEDDSSSASNPTGGQNNENSEAEPTHESSGCPELPVTLEAEDAALTHSRARSEVSGYQGDGYVAEFADVGDAVRFDVCVKTAGFYTLSFRFANGADGRATRSLMVDGERSPAAPSFAPSRGWDDWQQGSDQALYLEQGQHKLAIEYLASDLGELRLDNVTLSAGPAPSQESVRSLLMNNWRDLVVGWQAAKLYPADDHKFGPRLTALHSKLDWPTNQVDEAQLFFRDDTASKAFDQPDQLQSRAWFAADDEAGYGALHVAYGPYAGAALPVAIERRQSVPPEGDLIVVEYTLNNRTGDDHQLSLLEWVDAHNKTAGASEDPAETGETRSPSGSLRASWLDDSSSWLVDMTATNDTALLLGAFEAVDHHVAGEPVSQGPDASASTVRRFFEDPERLEDVDSFEAGDVGVGLSRTVTVPAGESRTVGFFYAMAGSAEEARQLASGVRDNAAADALAAQASKAWEQWLRSGKALDLEVPSGAWRQALTTALVTIRQAQQPEFGSFVAATNPAYFYSVWPRDAAVTALGLDAAGYLDVAEKYWAWMADIQADGTNDDYPRGTFWTNYGYWSQQRGIDFVHPEWDSLGLFLVGVFHHHQALQALGADRASAFLDDVWPAVRDAADFIRHGANDVENHGFGPQDFSIWEEDIAYQTFTQTTYVAGLRAAELLAEQRDVDGSAWGEASTSVRQAIFRTTATAPCPGLWDKQKHYFVRSVKPDCTPDARVDAATDLLWVLGVLDAQSSKALQHRDAVLGNATPGAWDLGISRYEGDEFYHDAEFSPGGAFEAVEPMPIWPQMSMYMSMLEHWTGLDDTAAHRLSWYVATSPAGYVPHGEAVDWSTQRPLISTAAEPVTGSWFTLALLNYADVFDPRLPARDDW